MRVAYVNGRHHDAIQVWESRDALDWIKGVFEIPQIEIRKQCTKEVREHVYEAFESEGWALNPKIDQEVELTIGALKNDLGFQLQTGNMSRAPYDLLKLQYLWQSKKITAAALALPTKEAANRIGSNIANAERISNELSIFYQVITVPILIVAFE